MTVPNTSEQNGRAERAGKTFNNQARATCIDAGIPELMWPFAVESSVYVNNLLPMSVNPNHKSPHERLMEWFDAPERSVKPFIRHLRAFACVGYVHLKGCHKGLEKPKKSQKMAPRAVKGHLVGYEGLRGHIFKIWIPEQNIVVRTHDVHFFNESDEDNDDDHEGIQHLVSFEEVYDESTNEEEEMMPRFVLDWQGSRSIGGSIEKAGGSVATEAPMTPENFQPSLTGYLPTPMDMNTQLLSENVRSSSAVEHNDVSLNDLEIVEEHPLPLVEVEDIMRHSDRSAT